MAGYTTVAIFPTETAETIGFVLGHSEASLLFVGKLDAWEEQRRRRAGWLPCVAFRSHRRPGSTPTMRSSRAPSRSPDGPAAGPRTWRC